MRVVMDSVVRLICGPGDDPATSPRFHDACDTLWLFDEAHRCPEPCECCGLLIALDGRVRSDRPRWVERFVHDGMFCYMSDVAHTPNRCRRWRVGQDLPQGLGSKPIPPELL